MTEGTSTHDSWTFCKPDTPGTPCHANITEVREEDSTTYDYGIHIPSLSKILHPDLDPHNPCREIVELWVATNQPTRMGVGPLTLTQLKDLQIFQRRCNPLARKNFVTFFDQIQDVAYLTAKDHGFWDHPGDLGNLIAKMALIHTEISEATEALRKDPSKPDYHCPNHINLVIELADAMIRIMDFAGYQKLPLAEAILAKMAVNHCRARLHGKNF